MNLKKCFKNIISYDHSHEGSIYTLEIKGSLLNELVEKFKLTNYFRYIEFFDNYTVHLVKNKEMRIKKK